MPENEPMPDATPASRHFDIFAPTKDEAERITGAPFLGTDEAGWAEFARLVHFQLVQAYIEGDVSLERALRCMMSCSVGCASTIRAALMALTARKMLLHTPLAPYDARRKNAKWVRVSAANLVEMLRADRPGEAYAPHEHNGWTTPILEEAGAWLVVLGITEGVDARTIFRWHGEAEKAGDLNTPVQSIDESDA